MDNKYLPASVTARDPILEKIPVSLTQTFWCKNCNCPRPVSMRIMKMVNGNYGRKVPHARCTVCIDKST